MPQIIPPTRKFYWTQHAKDKLRYYNLSGQRVKRVFRHPHRIEEGVAERTLAAMQRAGSKKHPYEIWLMYQLTKDKIKVISAWKYPGQTKAGERVPIPREILADLDVVFKADS